jgi:hypothetical protein
MKIKVIAYASDTNTGTHAITFASEAELHAHLKNIMEGDLKHWAESGEEGDLVAEVKALIEAGKIADAFNKWSDSDGFGDSGLKDPMDTYTWDEALLEIPGHLCPECGERLVHPRDLESYCEECHWPNPIEGESMAKQVVVTVEGGVVQDVDVPDGVQVVVQDFDTEGVDESKLVESIGYNQKCSMALYGPAGELPHDLIQR